MSPVSTIQVAPERVEIMPESRGASSSHASIMHSDDENVKECQKGSCEVVFRDLEAGLPIDITSSVDEEGMYGVDLVEDLKCSGLVESKNEAVPLEVHDHDHDAASCDVKDLVNSELREPLLARAQTDDTQSSQDKEVLLGGENKLGGDSLEKEGEVHGLRKRRGAKADAIKLSAGGDSGPRKMPEEHKKGLTTTRTKDASTDVNQDTKQKPVDKKTGKQGKSTGKPAAVKKAGDAQPLEESRAKEEAEANRKVHESLDNFIRQTIRCEPYMNFNSRPGDKPLQRLRPDVFENHVAGKFARGFKVENGTDPRDTATEENRGVDVNSSDMDGLKDGSNGSAKGSSGLRTGAQHSLKVPPGVVAFTQSASKGSDLQGWLSPSKTKCEKCIREFCSTLNYRRHIRVHRRSLNPEKEDLSKERSKVAAFWDKLTPEEAGSIVHYDNMEIEDLSGQAALDALKAFIHQPGLPSLPQGILKAGSLLLDIVRGYVPLSSERLLAILDDASERTFLCGGTSIAVQRFIFNGEAGKVGLEERNVVASMGFHIELNLVKAWMADKEAEALRCQQALFKEEEAAQQKRKKLLEKKRMKKIRQKERKGTTSQLILQELENESIDDEGNVQGIGEEDDSPTGTGSSSSSLVSAQDLALPESAELDGADAVTHTDIIDEHELALEEKSDTGKDTPGDDDQLHLSQDGLSQYGLERQQDGGHREGIESLYRKEDPSTRDSVIEVGAIPQPTSADVVDWDGDFDSRPCHPNSPSRNGRTGEAQFNPYYRKGEQDRIGSDLGRREIERSVQERKPLRIPRDRSRNDYSEQKPLRDSRGFDGRYGDNHPTGFKPLRKPNSYFVKGDAGNSDSSNISRLQQYRSKSLGMSRASSTAGNAQVVWTRKVPQAVAVEVTKDRQEDDGENSKGDGWAASEALPEVASSIPDIAGRDVASNVDKERMEKKDDATTPVPLDASAGNVITIPTSYSASVSFHIDVHSEDWPQLPQRFGSNCSSGTSLVAKSASFHSSASILVEEHIASLSQISEGDSRTVVGSCSDGSSGLMKTTLSSVRLQDSRLTGPGDDLISAEEIPEVDEDLSGALLVGSLSVPLGKFATVNIPHPRSGSSAPHLHHADDSEGGNVSAAGSHEESHVLAGVMHSFQEVRLSTHGHTATGSSDGSEPLEKGLGSSLRASGSRSNPTTAPPANLKTKISSTSPERGEHSRHIASPLGHDRPAVKQGSWQTAAGRYIPAKVWRAVGVVGERQELHATGGDSASIFIEARLSQDVDSSGSEGEGETSPTADLVREDEFLRGDSQERHDPDDHLKSESEFLSDGKSGCRSKAQSNNGVEISVYVDAGTFLNERWKAALAHASVDELLVIPTDIMSDEAEGLNFLDMLSRQISKESSLHSPRAESGPSPSSFNSTQLLSGKPSQDESGSLSKIFVDSEHTGVDDIRCSSTVDEQGLDGASPRAPSSEDDAVLRDASTSPLGSEHYMSGSETASAAPLVRGENFPTSGGGGGVDSSYARRGNSRQERWHRNSRDRYPQQRYMTRRRAPVEKNCSVTRV